MVRLTLRRTIGPLGREKIFLLIVPQGDALGWVNTGPSAQTINYFGGPAMSRFLLRKTLLAIPAILLVASAIVNAADDKKPTKKDAGKPAKKHVRVTISKETTYLHFLKT
jgi:hypothetical protein